jgi:hypothetical protein
MTLHLLWTSKTILGLRDVLMVQFLIVYNAVQSKQCSLY